MALGFGDIPTSAFAEAFNLVTDGGWIAFNIKQDFVQQHDSTGFAKLIQDIIDDGSFDLAVARPYHHRLAIDGKPLTYVAMVGRKRSDILEDMVMVSAAGAEART